MVDVLFAHQKHPIEPLGIGYITSSIARGGHTARMVLVPKDMNRAQALVEAEIQRRKPTIFAQSSIFGSHGPAIELNRRMKENHPDIITFLGGPAATFTPRLIHYGFDAICRYEGENPFLEFCNALQAGEDVGNIPNIWAKRSPLFKTEVRRIKLPMDLDSQEYAHTSGYDPENGIFVNDTRRLLESDALNELPLPDRKIMYDNLIVEEGEDPGIFRDGSIKHFMSTRGCAFHCAYCHVEMMNLENRGKGKPVRRLTNERVGDEVESVMKQYGGELVYFQDDILGAGYSLPLATEFADVFEKLGYPLHAHMRFDLAAKDEGIVRQLARAGVTGVHIAIEAGDEKLRNDVHRRGMSDKQIFEGAEYHHRYGIRMMTQNILGAPGETREQMIRTYEMNQAVRPTFASASIFQPYPGTSELEYARDKGHLPNMNQRKLIETFGLDTFYGKSILSLDPRQSRWLYVFQKFFGIGVDEGLSVSDLERRMEPYMNDDSKDDELKRMYREHRARKDEELYGVKLHATVTA